MYENESNGLPTIEFVGGETQDLAFNIYFYRGKKPYSLSGCTANFSIVSFRNKTGEPIVSKEMTSRFCHDGSCNNVLTVTLSPTDTINLAGKYIYEIQIKDIDGDVEIPKQGILYITNNINKAFIGQEADAVMRRLF